jgi:hypothetical protein
MVIFGNGILDSSNFEIADKIVPLQPFFKSNRIGVDLNNTRSVSGLK